MRAVRLVEALGALFFLGLSLWAWLEVLGLPLGYFGDVFRNLFWLAAALELLGGFLLLDLLLGSAALGRLYRAWHSRAASLPYEVRLGSVRVRVGSPEAMMLAMPFWLAAMLLLASTIIAYDSPTPVFMLQFTMMAAAVMAATWLTMKGLLEDPLSVTLRRAGRSWRRVALLVPWYSRLASISLRGRRPLLALASSLQYTRPLRLLERLALEAGLPFTRRELAIIIVSTPVAAALAPGSQPEARVRSLVLDLSLAAHAMSRVSDMLRDAASCMKGCVF